MSNLAPYDITLSEVILFNFEGNQLDVSNLLNGFEIVENIFKTFVSGTFSFTNAIGLIEKFPIIGEEFLLISFKGMATKKPNQWLFMVDSIVDRKEATDSSETFSLVCQSPEWLANKFSSVDGSYIGMKISDIASKVYKDILVDKLRYPTGNKFAVKNKKITIDPTDGLHSFVGAMEHPVDFMKRLLKTAQSLKYKESDYLFYETARGFNFRAVSALLGEEVKEQYYYDMKPLTNSLDNREIKNNQVIQTYVFNNSVDVQNNIEAGLYDNEICYIDLLTKQYKEKRFVYHRDYKDSKFSVLGSKKLTTKNSIFSKENQRSPVSTFIMSNISDSYNIPYIKDKIEKTTTSDPHIRWPSKQHEIHTYRTSKAAQLINTLSLSILVPGNTTLSAGDLIEVFIPERTSTFKDAYKYNHFLGSSNPKCLITSLKHIFISSKFMTILKCVKPGYEGKIKARDI